MASAAEGDAAAFEELYRRHHLYVKRVAKRVTGNEEDARDAAAEAFTRILGVLSSSGLRHRSSFRSYLRTTVRHVAIDKVRQRRRIQSTDEIESFDSVSSARGPADSVVTSEDGRRVLEAFNHLPQRSRSVLWLVDVERVPAQEAADTLGLSPNNVAQIAVRARGRLWRSYVDGHLSGDVDLGCRSTVRHLGPYLDGRLAAASVVEVDGHLRECLSCQNRMEQLADAGVARRRRLFPILAFPELIRMFRRTRSRPVSDALLRTAEVGSDAVVRSGPLGAHLATVTSNPTVIDLLQGVGQSAVVQRVVAGLAAGTMAIGASSLTLKTDSNAAEPAGAPVIASVQQAGRPELDLQGVANPQLGTSPVSVPPLANSSVGAVPLATPPLSIPPVSTPPLTTPPVSTPPVSAPPLTTPPVSTPALGGIQPLGVLR